MSLLTLCNRSNILSIKNPHAEGQTRKGGASREQDEVEVEASTDTTAESRDVLDDVDELLEEIDDVLEENAEEFVRSYVQKGGE